MYKNAHAIANQKAALIQLAVCKASRVATPKNSRNIVKFVPNLIFLISASIQSISLVPPAELQVIRPAAWLNARQPVSNTYAVAAFAVFSSVGALISTLRVVVSAFGNGIVISSTPLRNVAAVFSVFTPSGRGIRR